MDWLTPVLGAVIDNSARLIREATKSHSQKTLKGVSLHKFYEEVESIEELLSGKNLTDFKECISTLEDFLCICNPEEGVVVQHILTLTMSAYTSLRDQGEEFVGSSAYLISEAKKQLEDALKKAARTKSQLKFAQPACSVFINVLLDGAEVPSIIKIV